CRALLVLQRTVLSQSGSHRRVQDSLTPRRPCEGGTTMGGAHTCPSTATSRAVVEMRRIEVARSSAYDYSSSLASCWIDHSLRHRLCRDEEPGPGAHKR